MKTRIKNSTPRLKYYVVQGHFPIIYFNFVLSLEPGVRLDTGTDSRSTAFKEQIARDRLLYLFSVKV